MKRFLSIVLTLVLSLTTLTFFSCTQKQEDAVEEMPVVTPVPKMACAMSAIATLAEVDGVTAITKRISASVTPENASNKAVKYSVAWEEGAERSSEDVTKYVNVIQDSEGSLTALVYCYKAFGDDKIIITVETISGGLKATCIVTYAGIATSVELESTTAPLKTTARGTYYALAPNSEYQFVYSVVNVLGEANNFELKADDLLGQSV